jgi:hypothetical protein
MIPKEDAIYICVGVFGGAISAIIAILIKIHIKAKIFTMSKFSVSKNINEESVSKQKSFHV